MSDSSLTKKISESITNIFTQELLSLQRMKLYLNLFLMFSSILGITNVVINYYNYNNNVNNNVNNDVNNDVNNNINNIKSILRLLSDIEISNDNRFNDLENKITALENKLVILLGIQDKYLKEIKDAPILSIRKSELVSKSSSSSSCSSIISNDLLKNINEYHEIKDDEYDIISLKY